MNLQNDQNQYKSWPWWWSRWCCSYLQHQKKIIKPKRIFINVWGILTFVTNQKNFEIIFVWVLLHSNLIFCGATITIKRIANAAATKPTNNNQQKTEFFIRQKLNDFSSTIHYDNTHQMWSLCQFLYFVAVVVSPDIRFLFLCLQLVKSVTRWCSWWWWRSSSDNDQQLQRSHHYEQQQQQFIF